MQTKFSARHITQEKLFKKRIAMEIKKLKNDPELRYEYGIDIFKRSEDSDYHYIAVFNGPLDSPYEHGIFFSTLTFPKTYPFKPPTMQLLTKLYSPNFSEDGKHTCDYTHWNPGQTFDYLILKVRSLLNPGVCEAINNTATRLFMRDRSQFDELALYYTSAFANGDFVKFYMWIQSIIATVGWLKDYSDTVAPIIIKFCGCYVIEENAEILYGPVSDMSFVTNEAKVHPLVTNVTNGK